MDTVKVFYMNEQTVPNNQSLSPSAGKPLKVVESWTRLGFPIELQSFKPLEAAEIAIAHDPNYVNDILTCKKVNGFNNTSKDVAASLHYTTGSMVHAALHALNTGEPTSSPTSGFHHAGYAFGGGFCTFNGLMIAAMIARVNGAKRVGIVDCDEHYGNGQVDIINRLNLTREIPHYTLGPSKVTPDNAEQWLASFPLLLQALFSKCDLILYQAGADPWVNDPYGGRLNKSQLYRRDLAVFNFCRENNIGVVFNLAGGYADQFQHVLDIHNNTMVAVCNTYMNQDEFHPVLDDGPILKRNYVIDPSTDDSHSQ